MQPNNYLNNQSTNQSTNQSINQSINHQSTNQSINRSINQLTPNETKPEFCEGEPCIVPVGQTEEDQNMPPLMRTPFTEKRKEIMIFVLENSYSKLGDI